MQIVDRIEAISAVFRESGGKIPYTVRTLTDVLVRDYGDLFKERPHASTITRNIELLIERDFPLVKNSPDAAAMGISGSKRQTTWIYAGDNAVSDSLDLLTDVHAKLETVTALTVAKGMLGTLTGLRIRDALTSVVKIISKDPRVASRIRDTKAAAGKYLIGQRPKPKNTSSLKEMTKTRTLEAVFRTIDTCVREGRRVRIHHKHQYDQPGERAYVLEPRCFFERLGATYLVAHEVPGPGKPLRIQPRLFKLTRISKAEKLLAQSEFEYDTTGCLTGRAWTVGVKDRPTFSIDNVLDRTIHAWFPRPGEQPLRDVVIEVRKEAANWVVEEMINPQQDYSGLVFGDGTKGLRVTIAEAYQNDIVPRILGLGPLVKVVSPPELVAVVRDKLVAAAGYYHAVSPLATTEGGKPAAPRGPDEAAQAASQALSQA